MLFSSFMIIFSLAFILFSCFIFTNAVEWLGSLLNLGQGVVGSIFAAVGTALPETIIPIIAILFGSSGNTSEIGIGAIAGAPFMLGTLALFVTGFAVFIYSLIGKRPIKMNVDTNVVTRDLKFFVIIYGIAVLTTFVHTHIYIKTIIAVVLLLSYVLYLKNTLSDETDEIENLDPLYITKIFKLKMNIFWVALQLVISLVCIILGAKLFVNHVENVSTMLGIAPLILSIIITPIATELPEKLNSVIWTGKGKDTLALGNITGAMVFQSCFPVVFGMIFTPWNLTGVTMVSAILALTSAVLNLLWIKIKKNINPFALMFGGVLYLIFILYIFA